MQENFKRRKSSGGTKWHKYPVSQPQCFTTQQFHNREKWKRPITWFVWPQIPQPLQGHDRSQHRQGQAAHVMTADGRSEASDCNVAINFSKMSVRSSKDCRCCRSTATRS